MRIVLFILILAVVALLIAFASGFMTVTQTRGAQAPEVSVDRTGVNAAGGQTPAFDIETGTVAVGTTSTNVRVPTVNVIPPEREQPQADGNIG